MQLETVTIDKLKNGALGEMLDDAFQKVLVNINDPNMSEAAARKVTAVVNFKPKKRPGSSKIYIEYSLDVKTTMAQQKPVLGELLPGSEDGKLVCYEDLIDQIEMTFKGEAPLKIAEGGDIK